MSVLVEDFLCSVIKETLTMFFQFLRGQLVIKGRKKDRKFVLIKSTKQKN